MKRKYTSYSYKPTYDFSNLRGRIKACKLTEGEYASKIRRTANYVSKVFRCDSYFDARDIDLSCKVLDIPSTDIGYFFYNEGSQNANIISEVV